LRDALAQLDWRVHDSGDLKFDPPSSDDAQLPGKFGRAKNAVAVGRGSQIIYDAVQEAIDLGRFPLVIGGDHSVGLGSVAGVLKKRPNMGLLWIDAHADINTPAFSPSGNLHGMPIAFLMRAAGLDPGVVPGHEWLADVPVLEPSQLVYVGLRDVDEGEVKLIRDLNIRHFTMKHIDRWGIGEVMAMALDHLGERPIHMSFDIDSVDPEHAPSTGTLVRGGLSYREAQYVCEAAFESDRLASLDMVEVNPSLSLGEGAARTADLALQLVESAMGNSIIPRLD
jgi:arginase